MSQDRGFTIVELLVVIAIIGLLSAIVLASLSNARNKGNDAAVKSNLDNVRPQAAIFYETNGGYTTTGASVTAATTPASANCSTANTLFADSIIRQMINASETANGSSVTLCAYTANAAAWAVYSPLIVLTSGAGWCVDSLGHSGETSVLTGTACP